MFKLRKLLPFRGTRSALAGTVGIVAQSIVCCMHLEALRKDRKSSPPRVLVSEEDLQKQCASCGTERVLWIDWDTVIDLRVVESS